MLNPRNAHNSFVLNQTKIQKEEKFANKILKGSVLLLFAFLLLIFLRISIFYSTLYLTFQQTLNISFQIRNPSTERVKFQIYQIPLPGWGENIWIVEKEGISHQNQFKTGHWMIPLTEEDSFLLLEPKQELSFLLDLEDFDQLLRQEKAGLYTIKMKGSEYQGVFQDDHERKTLAEIGFHLEEGNTLTLSKLTSLLSPQFTTTAATAKQELTSISDLIIPDDYFKFHSSSLTSKLFIQWQDMPYLNEGIVNSDWLKELSFLWNYTKFIL